MSDSSSLVQYAANTDFTNRKNKIKEEKKKEANDRDDQ